MLIEEKVKNFLDGEFAEENIGVFLEIPETLPSSFIVFQLIGRGRENLVNEATLEFRSYAPSKYEAAVLDEKLRTALDKFHEESDVSCKLGGGNDDPDTVLKRYRYRCYYNLYY